MRFTHTLRWVLNDPLSCSLPYFHTNLKKVSEWINCRRNTFLSLIIIKCRFFFSRIFGEIKKMFWHILIIPEYNFVAPSRCFLLSLSSITLYVTHHDVPSYLPLFYYIRCNSSRCFLISLSSITLDVTHHDVSFSPSPLLH